MQYTSGSKRTLLAEPVVACLLGTTFDVPLNPNRAYSLYRFSAQSHQQNLLGSKPEPLTNTFPQETR